MSTDRISRNLNDRRIQDTLYSQIIDHHIITREHKKQLLQKSIKLADLSRQVIEIVGKPVLIAVIEKPLVDNYKISIEIKNSIIATISVITTDPVLTEEFKQEHEE